MGGNGLWTLTPAHKGPSEPSALGSTHSPGKRPHSNQTAAIKSVGVCPRRPGIRKKEFSRKSSDSLKRVGILAFADWVITYQEGMMKRTLTSQRPER